MDKFELAKTVVNGGPLVMRQDDDGAGLVEVSCPDGDWRGSVSEWQAALLAALSAKFVEGTLVIVAPETASEEQLIESVETARDMLPNPLVMLRHGWQAMDRSELLCAFDLAEQPHYPQLTDWVRAQPSGTNLLVVWSSYEPMASFVTTDAHQKVVSMIRESDLYPASFGYGNDFHAVWLSRHVDPSCEAKIPRGVKVYRER